MNRQFVCNLNPARVVFGAGSIARLADEVRQCGGTRALVLSTPGRGSDAEALAENLGETCAGIHAKAQMHTPVSVTQEALEAYEAARADCVVALGGGSAIGLGKAIAYRTGCAQVAVPTTYAGSEVTPILGQTEAGRKSTLRHPSVLPRAVIYDPDLTLSLPVSVSVTSGLNALAHAVEGIYAQDRNPVMTLIALEGARALRDALPAVVADPADPQARAEALQGAWLCGTVLGSVGMALHHKLCHTLGGAFDLPHAETHAALVPHTAAFNAVSVPETMQPLARLFGGEIGAGLWEFARALGAPLALRDLGMREDQIDAAAEQATRQPYWNPRPVEREAIAALLTRAWSGAPPPSSTEGKTA